MGSRHRLHRAPLGETNISLSNCIIAGDPKLDNPEVVDVQKGNP